LWCNVNQRHVPVVSFSLLVELSIHLHWQMSHSGRNKLIDSLKESAWHPSLSEVAADISASCSVCQFNKVSSMSTPPPVMKIQTAGPFDLIAADLVLLPRTSQGHIGCLVVVDHFSKWLVCVPIKNKQANHVASALEHRILTSLPGRPRRILTDNGKEFTAREFEHVLDRHDIQHVYSSPYKPSSNGAVERTNRTVIQLLRCLGSQSDVSWDIHLTKAVLNYNHSWHSQLLMSPSKFLLAKAHVRVTSTVLDSSTQRLWKEGHPNFHPYRCGDLVLKKVHFQGNSVTNKFLPRYSGPCTISAVRGNGLTYEIRRTLPSGQEQTSRAHYTQLKKWVALPGYVRKNAYFMDVLNKYTNRESEDALSNNTSTGSESLNFSGFLPVVSPSSSYSGFMLVSSSEDLVEEDTRLSVSFEEISPVSGFTSDGNDGSPCTSGGVGSSATSSLIVESYSINVGDIQGGSEYLVPVPFIPDEPVEVAVAQSQSPRCGEIEVSSPNLVKTLHPSPTPAIPAVESVLDVGCEVVGHLVYHSTPVGNPGTCSLPNLSPVPSGLPVPDFTSYQSSFSGFKLSYLDLQEGVLLETFQDSLATQELEVARLQGFLSLTVEDHPVIDEIAHVAPPVYVDVATQTTRVSTPLCGIPGPDHALDPVNTCLVACKGYEFSGFSAPNNSRSTPLRSRVSLSPLRQTLRDARDILEEYRRRSRARIRATHRPSLVDLPASELVIEVTPTGYQTRSRGAVDDLPNVQPRTLEFRSRNGEPEAAQ
jgi:hypothetical protein